MNNRRVPELGCDTNAPSSAVLPAEMPAERGEPPVPMRVDGWIARPDTATQRNSGRGSARRTETMAQQLTDLVEQFCNFQRKQRGKTEGGVRTYRWILEQFLIFVRNRYGRLARVTDLTSPTIQACDGRYGRGGSRAEHHAGPPVDPVELLCVVGQAGWAGGEPRGAAAPASPPRPAPEADPGRVHDGWSHRGGEGPPSAPRPGDLPDPALHGHAARVGGDAARPAPRWDLGSARRPGQGREDPRYSPSLGGHAVPAGVC